MAETFSAQIIPFPQRVTRVQDALVLEQAPDLENSAEPKRLSVALTSLAQAMADQQEAVATWRNAVRALATQMHTMSDTLATTKLKVGVRE